MLLHHVPQSMATPGNVTSDSRMIHPSHAERLYYCSRATWGTAPVRTTRARAALIVLPSIFSRQKLYVAPQLIFVFGRSGDWTRGGSEIMPAFHLPVLARP